MAQIKDEKQYKAIMARIDELFFETDENTPADDPRLQELDVLSALIEEYEKENYPIEAPSLSATMNARLVENHWSQKEMAAVLGMTAARLNAILSVNSGSRTAVSVSSFGAPLAFQATDRRFAKESLYLPMIQ